jgi:outer membrane protein
VGLDVKYNLGGRWMLLGNLSYGALPSKISDSPLVDDDRAAGLMIGVIRAF